MVARQPTIADQTRSLSMAWVWAAVFVVVAVFGAGLTPWDAVGELLQNQGVGDTQAQLIGFAAGLTLPLTAGMTILIYLLITGAAQNHSGPAIGVTVAAVLAGAGYLSAELGLGVLPITGSPPSAPFYISLPVWIISGYISYYGWALTVCSIAIAIALAMQFERWLGGSSQSTAS